MPVGSNNLLITTTSCILLAEDFIVAIHRALYDDVCQK